MAAKGGDVAVDPDNGLLRVLANDLFAAHVEQGLELPQENIGIDGGIDSNDARR